MDKQKIYGMLASLCDLIAYHGSVEEDLTDKQCETIEKLYNEVKPHDKIEERINAIRNR